MCIMCVCVCMHVCVSQLANQFSMAHIDLCHIFFQEHTMFSTV